MEFRGLRLDVLFSVASWQDLPWFFPVSVSSKRENLNYSASMMVVVIGLMVRRGLP
jgi:hypothetical protein